jgi:hypothetical protein
MPTRSKKKPASAGQPSVAEYLQSLPEDRRGVVAAVRGVIRKALPKGYEEAVNWGMINWQIPLSRYPDTYNKQPLACVSLAAQKSHYALYMMCTYMDPDLDRRLRDAYKAAGKKLDMGKSCLRFRKLEDLELAVIGEVVAAVPPEKLIEQYERSRSK